MLLLGAILLAIFVLPFPWGIIAVAAGGLLDVTESIVLLRWSRRRRAVTGAVSTPTQVRVAGELWEAQSEQELVPGDEVEVTGLEGLTLRVSRRNRAPR